MDRDPACRGPAPRSTPAGRDRRSSEAGVTLVEMLVGFAILAMLMGAVATTLVQSMDLTEEARWHVVAANVATSETEALRLADPRQVPVGTDVFTRTTSLGDVQVERTAEWVAADSTADACQSPTDSPRDLLRVTVEVVWPDGRYPSATTQTVLTPDVGTRNIDRGHIAVRLMDRDAKPPTPRPLVKVTGGPDHVNRTGMVSDAGCLLVDHLKPGDYDVEVLADGVDEQGGPPVTHAVVQVAATTPVQITYDDASAIRATFTAQPGTAMPAGIDLVLRNTALLPDGRRDEPGTGVVRTVEGLFPFASGYEVFASVGGCAGIDPGAVERERTVVATEPGETTDATIPLATVRLRTINNGGQAVPGVPILALAAAGDEGCSGDNRLHLGRTGTPNELLVALPMGAWSFQATRADRPDQAAGPQTEPLVIADTDVVYEVEVQVGG